MTNPRYFATTWSVPHLRSVALLVPFAVLALATAAGCEKVNDMPRLQDEALEVAKIYRVRLDDLTRRADAIQPSQLTANDANWSYGQARGALDRVRNELQQLPIPVQEKAKSGNPEDLRKLIDALRARFESGLLDATWKLSAVESWLAMAAHPAGEPPRSAAPGSGTGESQPGPGSPEADR